MIRLITEPYSQASDTSFMGSLFTLLKTGTDRIPPSSMGLAHCVRRRFDTGYGPCFQSVSLHGHLMAPYRMGKWYQQPATERFGRSQIHPVPWQYCYRSA